MLKNKPMFYVKLFRNVIVAVNICLNIESAIANQVTSTSPIVEMVTTKGSIKIVLDENTPITTQNFIRYVKSGFYNGTIFHRIIDGFMIQGGGFLPDMKEKAAIFPPIRNEGAQCGSNTLGSVAMARTADPDSATSQFFINVNDNTFLDFQSKTLQGWGYCVFGHVIEGMDIVTKIKSVATTSYGGYQNVPINSVMIKRVEIVQSNHQS